MANADLEELKLLFPGADVLDSCEGIEFRTRSALALLFLSDPPRNFPAIEPNPRLCPNCDAVVAAQRSPYCSETCRERAAFVRQFRSAFRNGDLLNPDKQQALGQKLWFVLGGGYPCRDNLVPDKVRLKVIEREGNKCQQCGAKATTIDHSGSG